MINKVINKVINKMIDNKDKKSKLSRFSSQDLKIEI